jgi:hypothetical protein
VFTHAFLGLSQRGADRFWQVLARAQWTRACELRATLRSMSVIQSEGALQDLITRRLSPATIISALEDLRCEGLIDRREANTIIENILARTTKDGTWL